ncbi:MAG: hypothetical protein J1D87_07000 [Lachnospiraceae bacterium]|nr:hypothetical protein [Lachnospiraceae bacterium]
MKSIPMDSNKAKQGTDCYIFGMVFKGDLEDMPEQPLTNKQGKKYGKISIAYGKVTLALVLPSFIRENNEKSFTLLDADSLELIKSDCKKQLKHLLGTDIKIKIKSVEAKSIEVNITQKVSGKATQADVLNLINHACLSKFSDNVKYVGPNRNNPLKEETHTVIVKRPHYYVIKAYDKTQQLQSKLLSEHKPTSSVPSGLLRIELIFSDRTLYKLFGNRLNISNILSEDALKELMREYKRVFCDEMIPKIETYLDNCVSVLVESLCDTENPIATIAEHRELIPDTEVLRKALEQYNRLRGKSNHNLSRDVKRYTVKFGLPQDVLLTLYDFKKSCG